MSVIAGGGGVVRVIDGDSAGGDSGGRATSSSEPAGPGVGLRPSRNALAMSAAFHFAYRIFSSVESGVGDTASGFSLSNVRRISRKLAAARNFLAVPLVRISCNEAKRY